MNASANNTVRDSGVLVLVEYICNNFITPGICVFGIICHLINLVVLSQRLLKESPYTYLVGLSAADLGVLTLSLIRSIAISVRVRPVAFNYILAVYEAYVFFPVANVYSTASIWVTVLLTVERWLSVRLPLQAGYLCTKRLARRAILIAFALALIINTPRFFCKHIVADENWNNITVDSTPFEERSAVYYAITWFYVVVVLALPCVLVTFLNTYLLLLMYRAHVRRRSLYESTEEARRSEPQLYRKQTRLTLTCVSVICLFLVCIIPSLFSHMPLSHTIFAQSGQSSDTYKRTPFYMMLRSVTNLLVLCNYSLNFILYCLFNHKFVIALRSVASLCRPHVCLCTRGNDGDTGRTVTRRMSSYSVSWSNHAVRQSSTIVMSERLRITTHRPVLTRQGFYRPTNYEERTSARAGHNFAL